MAKAKAPCGIKIKDVSKEQAKNKKTLIKKKNSNKPK